MPSFDFKLHSVLRHREMIEQEARRVFAEASAAKSALEARVKQMDEAVHNVTADLRANHLTGTLDLVFLAGHRRFMMGMQRQGLDLVQQLHDANGVFETARVALAEAAKQRKILEKLREKQAARWHAALAAKERAASDEVAMQMSYAAGGEGE